MEIVRRAANPWGQEVLLGIGWDLFWVAVVAGLAFIVVHALLIVRLRRIAHEAASEAPAAAGASVPARVVRHDLPSRLFHWTMAASMFALLITAFVPVMGIQFDWVPIHWIAGLVLIGTVLFHIIHASFFQRLMSVWVSRRDVSEGMKELLYIVRGRGAPEEKAGKYPVANKLYHHGAAIATVAAIVTGLFMMVRIDTPVFEQNQYLLSDSTWGVIYVLHGVAGVGLVLMVIAHVYFAIRPEKQWQTRSMIKGWITRDEYLAHHDPERWPVGPEEEEGRVETTPPPSAVGAPSQP